MKRSNYVYVVKCGGFYKIGKSKNHPSARVKNMKTGNPFEIELSGYATFEDPSEMDRAEKILHKKYRDFNVNGEWFKLSKSELKRVFDDLNCDRVEFFENTFDQNKEINKELSKKKGCYFRVLKSRNKKIKITKRNLSLLENKFGQISRDAMEFLGVELPITKGWKKEIYGKEYNRRGFLNHCLTTYKKLD